MVHETEFLQKSNVKENFWSKKMPFETEFFRQNLISFDQNPNSKKDHLGAQFLSSLTLIN